MFLPSLCAASPDFAPRATLTTPRPKRLQYGHHHRRSDGDQKSTIIYDSRVLKWLSVHVTDLQFLSKSKVDYAHTTGGASLRSTWRKECSNQSMPGNLNSTEFW